MLSKEFMSYLLSSQGKSENRDEKFQETNPTHKMFYLILKTDTKTKEA